MNLAEALGQQQEIFFLGHSAHIEKFQAFVYCGSPVKGMIPVRRGIGIGVYPARQQLYLGPIDTVVFQLPPGGLGRHGNFIHLAVKPGHESPGGPFKTLVFGQFVDILGDVGVVGPGHRQLQELGQEQAQAAHRSRGADMDAIEVVLLQKVDDVQYRRKMLPNKRSNSRAL